jgi:hypothetical protein
MTLSVAMVVLMSLFSTMSYFFYPGGANVYIYSTDGLDIITDFNYDDSVISIDPTTNSRTM